MAKPTLDDLLAKARDGLHDENIITLLGAPDAGKTVVMALAKHALFHKFVPSHGGKFEALVVRGGEEVDAALRGMQVEGIFPSSTVPVNAPQMELEIHKMNGEGAGKIKLMLQDSSGEKYMSLLHQEFDDPKERLEAILSEKARNDDVGPLAPYVFSKVYLLVIECPKDSYWDVGPSPSAIHALRQIHQAAKLTHNQKVMTDIAILFTKSDVLDDGDLDTPASELLARIPQLESALKIVHGGKLECFKLSIDVQLESQQDRNQRISRSRKSANERLKLERRIYDQQLAKFVEKSARRARKEAESEYDESAESEYDEEATEQYVKEEETNAEKAFRSSNPPPALDFDPDKEGKIRYKVQDGFTYSEDEYVRLIDWLIDRLYD